MSLDGPEKRKKKFPLTWPLVVALCLIVLLIPLSLVLFRLHEDEGPRLALAAPVSHLGLSSEIGFAATDQRSGLRQVSLLLRQGDQEVPLFSREFPRQGRFFKAGPAEFTQTLTVAGPEAAGLADGPAELVLRARDYSWRNWLAGNETEAVFALVVDTRPPVISVGDVTLYVRAGGSGLVRYAIDEAVVRHGVLLNGFFHPGFPLDSATPGEYLAYIGLPFDTTAIGESLVIAEDKAGNQARTGFAFNLRPVDYPSDRINLSDGFLQAKLPEFSARYPEMAGSYLDQYLYVNRQVREMNDRRILEICANSQAERLWEGVFLRMARSSQRAGFADRRSYFYQGGKIDDQVHLGVDLASVRQAPIEAANHGIVAFADYLGIYGNTVIVDHGQGVFSLYSHLSRISVAQGARVEQGGVLGQSGVTGMAGGDHLHFSILVNGIFVDPVEWWDRAWVHNQLTPGS